MEASGQEQSVSLLLAGLKALPYHPDPPPDLSRKPRLIDAPETSGLSPELFQVSGTLRPEGFSSQSFHHLQPSLTGACLPSFRLLSI